MALWLCLGHVGGLGSVGVVSEEMGGFDEGSPLTM